MQAAADASMCQNETLCRHILHVTILHSTIVVPSLLCGNESSNAFFIIIIIYILFELCKLGERSLHLDTLTHTHTHIHQKA